ncbi:hypothetical protein K443DRAFT_120371 [Laccaria amethystina LaAM-08-1]|uniref:Alpha-type protein kinase domain-containing protein n=1 Tax=Laccaria amethystina LaAM-08-1 TaxID=1095629 RepID=A0A0C9XL46_9AGAR|nr:hypothetical protein K443DRAFT_120371 [Laccaria amethystina LaAM-08-1]
MSFPKKSSQVLCAKCSKLMALEDGSLQYEQWKCGRCVTSATASMPGDSTQQGTPLFLARVAPLHQPSFTPNMQLSIGSNHYIAKKFYEIGSDSEVTASENKVHLEKELIQLKMAAWSLEKFKAQAKERNFEFSADITISDGFLIWEVGAPLCASPLPLSEEDGAIWLVDPHHRKPVQKFSSTMVYPHCNDKIGKTLSAFTHFVYEFSKQELVLADMQGSRHLFHAEIY